MIVNMRTAVATVNIAFSSSKNADLIERKIMQYTTLSKTPSLYIERKETQVFTLSDVFACVSIHWTDQKQNSNRFFDKIY